MLAFAGISRTNFRICPVEVHVAEKLHALTLPRSRPNSRVKDLPDLALLGSIRPIDDATLRATIKRTFADRGTHAAPSEIPDPPDHWEGHYRRMAEMDDLQWSDIAAVMGAVRQFLNPVLGGNAGTWNPSRWRWQHEPR